MRRHALVADELEGVIDVVMSIERELTVEMFHSDEANEEAILFANWAYKSLHDAIIPVRHALAVSPVAWLLSLPYAVEILGQTRVDPATWTEVSTTAIYYKDWETRRIRRSFTCQFHPGTHGRHPRRRRTCRHALPGTEGQRRHPALHPHALPRDAGVTAWKWWAV